MGIGGARLGPWSHSGVRPAQLHEEGGAVEVGREPRYLGRRGHAGVLSLREAGRDSLRVRIADIERDRGGMDQGERQGVKCAQVPTRGAERIRIEGRDLAFAAIDCDIVDITSYNSRDIV